MLADTSPFNVTNINVLVADDEPVTRRLFESYLDRAGFNVTAAADGADAIQKMRPEVGVALIDLNMPGMDGLACLKRIRRDYPHTEVIIVSGVGQIPDAVTALKEGACEFITKPCDADDLVAHVQHAVRTSCLARENRNLRNVVSQPLPTREYAAQAESSRKLLQRAQKLAPLDSTILLTGESGTGKTTLARFIHERGPRSGKPFVAINCASLPRDLIESELFGHAKGAFTGAVDDRVGRAELANGGTLFLDEIGDLPLELQPKLLTFLQERCLQRIGSNDEIQVDVRLIAATHQDLEDMCEQQRFRPDLFYRLNVLHLDVPPMRHRREDIPQLAETVLERISQQRGSPPLSLEAAALRVLMQHDWPGNIRELENTLERASAFCNGSKILATDLEIDPHTTPVAAAETPTSYSGLTLKEIEKQALVVALKENLGNKAMAARQLGISEKSIYNKLKRFGLFQRQKPSNT